jgi:hypothetical protein
MFGQYLTFSALKCSRKHLKEKLPMRAGLKLPKLSMGQVWSHLQPRTPNDGINQRYLKNWANVAEKYASAVPKNLGVGVNFRPCIEGYFLSWRP